MTGHPLYIRELKSSMDGAARTIGDERDLAGRGEHVPRGRTSLQLSLKELHDAFCMTSDHLAKQAFEVEIFRVLHTISQFAAIPGNMCYSLSGAPPGR